MQSEGVPVVDQVTGFLSLILMLRMASFMLVSYPPMIKSNPAAGNNGEQTELLKKFSELNPEAQRGAIRYVEKMRKGYRKDLTKSE